MCLCFRWVFLEAHRRYFFHGDNDTCVRATGVDSALETVTINQHSFWENSTVYRNPNIANTPHGSSPNDAVGAVDHFAKRATLRKYNAPEDWKCNGLAALGEPELFDFWCVIRPSKTRSEIPHSVLDSGGEYQEGGWLLLYNPYHESHPEQGTHLQLSDAEADYSGFADVIEYQNKLWIVRKHQRIDIDYGDSENLYIGKASIERWNEPSHTSSHNPKTSGHYQIK